MNRSVGLWFAGRMVLLPLLLFSCQKNYPEPAISLAEFHLADTSFQIECIAAEPLVEAPVAMAFDEKNRIWVVEMPSYMPNLDGTGEDAPTGKIVILEDRDGDGRIDHRKIFLDSLVLPRALALVYGGVLYAEPPNLWFVKIKNDRPGERTLVDSLYAPGGNVEHQPNGLLLNIDNWIYSAKSDVRYRLRNGVWEKQSTFFRGQWGITHDDLGRLFYNDNSNVLQGDFFLPNVLERNPAWRPRYGLGQQICEDQRVFPLQATSVNRGYVEGMLDEEGKLKNVTSACAPVIYAGENFPPEFYENAFVCAPEANVVMRNILTETADGRITARKACLSPVSTSSADRTELCREFLASTDETFRPVNLFNSPDGCLYLLDMRRGIIQHKTYMTSYLRKQLEDKGLDSVSGKGRVYRIRWKGKPIATPPDFNRLKNSELVTLLAHENGYVRCKAQQILVEKQAVEVAPDLMGSVEKSENPIAAIHALWTLEGLEKLTPEVVEIALNSPLEPVVWTALQVIALSPNAEFMLSYGTRMNLLERLSSSEESSLVIAFGIQKWEEENTAFNDLNNFLERHPADSMFAECVLVALTGREKAFLRFEKAGYANLPTSHPVFSMLETAIANRKFLIEKHPSPRVSTDQLTHGLKLYVQLCAACHRPGGEGIPNVAPPLLHSKTASGSPEKIVGIILHGLDKPLEINGKKVVFNNAMPAFKDNPALTQKDVEAIAAYVKNAFGEVRAER